MKISLIGMSGSGKTYWSKKLSENGFINFCCDDLIEKKLGKELISLGYHGIEDVAKWMGQPFSSQYPKTSKRYLYFEQKVMEELLDLLERLDNIDESRNIVIDTTGSMIYIDQKIIKKLTKQTTVVYLDTPASIKQEMYELYLKEPKPVIWGNSFRKNKHETDIETLRRCYPDLLAFRTKAYEKIAHITLDYRALHQPNYSLKYFLEAIDNSFVYNFFEVNKE